MLTLCKCRLACCSKDYVAHFLPEIPAPAVFDADDMCRNLIITKRMTCVWTVLLTTARVCSDQRPHCVAIQSWSEGMQPRPVVLCLTRCR
jgi:hypothetical protein